MRKVGLPRPQAHFQGELALGVGGRAIARGPQAVLDVPARGHSGIADRLAVGVDNDALELDLFGLGLRLGVLRQRGEHGKHQHCCKQHRAFHGFLRYKEYDHPDILLH